jgi:hypothetical protein
MEPIGNFGNRAAAVKFDEDGQHPAVKRDNTAVFQIRGSEYHRADISKRLRHYGPHPDSKSRPAIKRLKSLMKCWKHPADTGQWLRKQCGYT